MRRLSNIPITKTSSCLKTPLQASILCMAIKRQQNKPHTVPHSRSLNQSVSPSPNPSLNQSGKLMSRQGRIESTISERRGFLEINTWAEKQTSHADERLLTRMFETQGPNCRYCVLSCLWLIVVCCGWKSDTLERDKGPRSWVWLAIVLISKRVSTMDVGGVCFCDALLPSSSLCVPRVFGGTRRAVGRWLEGQAG